MTLQCSEELRAAYMILSILTLVCLYGLMKVVSNADTQSEHMAMGGACKRFTDNKMKMHQ